MLALAQGTELLGHWSQAVAAEAVMTAVAAGAETAEGQVEAE